MNIEHMNSEQLKCCIRTLQRAKDHRPGGLLEGERIALANMEAELELRELMGKSDFVRPADKS